MRNKPTKLYLLLDQHDNPYRVAGKVKAFNGQGKAIQKAKLLYNKSAALYRVVRAGLTLKATTGE